MRDLSRLGSARRKHRFVYCCVIVGACFDVTVLAWRKYATILWRIDPLLGNDSVNTFPRKRTRAAIWRLLLGNGSVNWPKTIRDNRRRLPWGPLRGYITGRSKVAVSCYQKLREFSWRRIHLSELLSSIGLSSGYGNRRWLKRNGNKWGRLWKEDFMRDLKWQWDC
jgi:hypothetical protein